MKLKRLFFILMILLLSLPAFAQNRIIDNAGLLNSEQKASLESQIASIAAAYNFDLVIVTETDIGAYSPRDYADDFFDNNGYGLGAGRDGCIFLQVTESRDMWISTSGTGIKILNNTAYGKLEDDVIKFLRNDNYFEAYQAFLYNWENFLSMNANERSYNFFHRWNVVLLFISWTLAILTGLIVVLVWKKQMNTALAQTQADAYTVQGSLAYAAKTDKLLYSKVTKVRRQNQSSSAAGTLAAAGKHLSSSGRSHSGRGRKY